MSANTLPSPATAVPGAPPFATPVGGLSQSLPWPEAGRYLVLSGISWKQYITITDTLAGRHLRCTFDRGTLEIMTLSFLHERLAYLIGRFIDAVTEEMNIAMTSGRSTTCRREDLDRGLEPDNCYWLAHEAQVRNLDRIDLQADPPPDLAVEVEVSRTVLDRLALYAALGVPEVWRFDGQTLRVLLRGNDGEYHENAISSAFPFLPVAELLRFAALRQTRDDTQVIRAFRQWVREQMAANWSRPPSASPSN
jgi:Uma2 family endonuclease